MATDTGTTDLTIPESLRARILDHLVFLYGGEQADSVWQRLYVILDDFHRRTLATKRAPAGDNLSERDAILITYGDQFREPDTPPLQTLHRTLTQTLGGIVPGVHILPFFPYSSDDGFSIIDYAQVNPDWGKWSDVGRIGRDYRLMVDLVVNHVSRHSEWFQRFLAGDPEYAGWFIAFDPDVPTDWIPKVTRPRALPLLTPVQTATGQKLVWTTFSEDQIDLNFAHPPVLLRIIEVLLLYVAQGAQIIRLDAIAYLWKKIGTACIHLEETHRVVKLMRCVLDAVAPGVILITETNVPHEENISYFGDLNADTGGTDEAQLVYQFPLAPLVMHSLLSGDAQVLLEWAAGLEAPSPQATFFNFTASHDGIGVMPARGLLSEAEIQALVDATLVHGGRVSYKTNPDGSQSVYELNISYFDALSDPSAGEPQATQVARFSASQAIMLALVGVPGIYVHSLLGSRSWQEGVVQAGHNRTINRQKFDRATLDRELADPSSQRHQVFGEYRRLLQARASDPAFHPFGDQQVLILNEHVFALLRTSPASAGQGLSRVLCLHNVSGHAQPVPLHPGNLRLPPGGWHDLLSGETVIVGEEGLTLTLLPYAVRWLKA
jgi:sucrose phosphorylase